MSRLQRLCLLFGFAAILLAVGTGSFSASTTTRSVSVDVVDDDEAMLGLDANDPDLAVGANESRTHSEVTLLTVANRFKSPITSITITELSTDGTAVEVDAVESSAVTIEPGEDSTVVSTVRCTDTGTASVTVHVEAQSASTSVETSKSVTVTCTG